MSFWSKVLLRLAIILLCIMVFWVLLSDESFLDQKQRSLTRHELISHQLQVHCASFLGGEALLHGNRFIPWCFITFCATVTKDIFSFYKNNGVGTFRRLTHHFQ
jgi:hypothetical protein